MASYRYERDINPKDLKPRKQRQYSRRERWANWWDYNLKWVLLFGIAGAFVAYCFIGQYFLTTHPDYNVAVVSPYYLPEATVTALQEQLAAYGEDCNGDGKVVVKLNQYTMAFNSEDSDAYLDMAGTTKLSTDIQSSLSSIFILYDPAGFQQTTGTLRYLDGHLPKSDADSDWWNMVYRWTDCPVLTGMELGSYTSDAVQSASGDSQQLLADYYIGIRGAWLKESASLLENSELLWANLTAGAVSTAGDAKYGRLVNGESGFQNTETSSLYLFNGNYLKLKNLTVGYTLPAAVSKKAYMDNLRLYVSIENVFNITKYPGQDPELGAYPEYTSLRQFAFGVNVTF